MSKTAMQMTRMEALFWWRALGETMQREITAKWQNSLPENTGMKKWEFEMISASSSTIHRIYEFAKPSPNK